MLLVDGLQYGWNEEINKKGVGQETHTNLKLNLIYFNEFLKAYLLLSFITRISKRINQPLHTGHINPMTYRMSPFAGYFYCS